MAKLIKIKINDKEYEVYEGQTILEVVRQNKIDSIPTLCHRDDLEPYTSCFLCVVEIKGKSNLVPSCATKVYEGMEIITKNPRIIASRKTALELIISNHYADCVAPCALGCPAHVDIQSYVALAAIGEYVEAARIIRQNNPFVSVCARVCVRKCERMCRRSLYDEPVAINDVKRYVADDPRIYEIFEQRQPKTGKKVAIVGSGPSGLSAAYYLGLWGHDVSIYEAMPKAGGMLRYGIPEYRLPKKVLEKEIDYILTASGAKIYFNTKVGKDISLKELKESYDAVYIATGAFGSNSMRIPNEHSTKGVLLGIDFLRDKNENPSSIKGTVVVVGGGNTAMDAARVSVRLGADKVIILYRRTKAQMPADPEEIKGCEVEGVQIIELAAPVEIIQDTRGQLRALKCIRMKLGEPDSSGRQSPVPIEGSEFELPCDMVISAIGQKPDIQAMCEDLGIKLTRWGTVAVDPKTMMSSVPGIFCGGDTADDGPTVVIDAIADGKHAAESIHKYLCSLSDISYQSLQTVFHVKKDDFSKIGQDDVKNIIKDFPQKDLFLDKRHHSREVDPQIRKNNFEEICLGLDSISMLEEAQRCLGCGCAAYSSCDLRTYAQEYGVEIGKFAGKYNKFKVHRTHPHIVYDPNKCILCGKCIRVCENMIGMSALGWVNRGVKTIMSFALGKPLEETNCISCGNCVDACPTGALYFKLINQRIFSYTNKTLQAICPLCSLACKINIHFVGEKTFYITSSSEPQSYLCAYGRFAYKKLFEYPNINSCKMKIENTFKEVSLDEALIFSVNKIKNILYTYGANSLAILASANLGNEELSLIHILAKDRFKTNNVGSLSLLFSKTYHFDKFKNIAEYIKYDKISIDEAFEQVDLIFIIASNTEHYPYINSHIIKTLRNKSSKLIYIHYDFNNSISKLADIAINLAANPHIIKDLSLFLQTQLTHSQNIEDRLLTDIKEVVTNSKNILFIYEDKVSAGSTLLHDVANFLDIIKNLNLKFNLLIPNKFSNYQGLIKNSLDPAIDASNHLLSGAKTYDELLELFKTKKIKGAIVIGEDFIHLDPKILKDYFGDLEFFICFGSLENELSYLAHVHIPYHNVFETDVHRFNILGQCIHYFPIIKPQNDIKTSSLKKFLDLLM